MEALFSNTTTQVYFNYELRQLELYKYNQLIYKKFISFNTAENEIIEQAREIYKKAHYKTYIQRYSIF